MTLTVGQSKDITVTTDPADATNANKIIATTTASLNDNTVATIAKGAVTGAFTVSGIKSGTTTATFNSGNLSTTLTVTVNDVTDPAK